MRLDRVDDRLHTLHHGGEIEAGVGRIDAEFARAFHMRQEFRRTDQGLRRHAAEVQAIATHLVLFHQGDPGLDGGGDVGGHQAAGAGADHHHVAIEGFGFQVEPLRIDLARLEHVHHLLRDQRENAQQHERTHQAGRENALQGTDLRQLGAGIDVHDGAGEHADLAHQIIGQGLDWREAHQQVDREKRNRRNQAQREQIETAFARDAGVDRR